MGYQHPIDTLAIHIDNLQCDIPNRHQVPYRWNMSQVGQDEQEYNHDLNTGADEHELTPLLLLHIKSYGVPQLELGPRW
jgi:hypothetical protein